MLFGHFFRSQDLLEIFDVYKVFLKIDFVYQYDRHRIAKHLGFRYPMVKTMNITLKAETFGNLL